MLKKLKSFILCDTTFVGLLLVATAVCSFGLGRLTVLQTRSSLDNQTVLTAVEAQAEAKTAFTAHTSVATTTTVFSPLSEPVTLKSAVVDEPVAFVASKAGTRFHALTCPGAKQIKESNKIYFTSEAEAEAAGYSRAANCPVR